MASCRECSARRPKIVYRQISFGFSAAGFVPEPKARVLEEMLMNSIIYLVGLVVIVMAILSFIGLR